MDHQDDKKGILNLTLCIYIVVSLSNRYSINLRIRMIIKC